MNTATSSRFSCARSALSVPGRVSNTSQNLDVPVQPGLVHGTNLRSRTLRSAASGGILPPGWLASGPQESARTAIARAQADAFAAMPDAASEPMRRCGCLPARAMRRERTERLGPIPPRHVPKPEQPGSPHPLSVPISPQRAQPANRFFVNGRMEASAVCPRTSASPD